MKKIIKALGGLAALASIIALAIQIWPEPDPRINVMVEERSPGHLLIRAVTDNGSPIANGSALVKPDSTSRLNIITSTNSRGELELNARELIRDNPGEDDWSLNGRFVRETGSIPIYVRIGQDGYRTGELTTSIKVK